jgi:hypothetical protein
MHTLSNVDLLEEQRHREGGGVRRRRWLRAKARWFAKLIVHREWVVLSQRVRPSLLGWPTLTVMIRGRVHREGGGTLGTRCRCSRPDRSPGVTPCGAFG